MNPHDADNAMAGDYVMGLLDDAEHAAAERRIATDQSFAQAVSAWRGRLADLDLTAEETPPSPALWQRIADATKIAPIDALPSARAALRGTELWHDIRFWRGARYRRRLRCALFAMIMIGALTTSRQLRHDMIALAQRKPIYVAVLVNDTTKEAGAIVNAFSNGRVELIPLRPIEVPAGRTLQVWTLVGSRSRPEIDRRHRSVAHAAARPGVAAGNRAKSTVRDHAGAGRRLAHRTADRPNPVQGQRGTGVVVALASAKLSLDPFP